MTNDSPAGASDSYPSLAELVRTKLEDAGARDRVVNVTIAIQTARMLVEHAEREHRIAMAAAAYVDIRCRDPQVAGEAWRDMCAAVDG